MAEFGGLFSIALGTPVTGVHDVYIRFDTHYVDVNGLVNFDWIQFR
jgi:hypothetical protein